MSDADHLPRDAFACPNCGEAGIDMFLDADEFAPSWSVRRWREDGTPAAILVAVGEDPEGPTEIRELTREDVEEARELAGPRNLHCGICTAFFAEPVRAKDEGEND